jgi:hypothetical protein
LKYKWKESFDVESALERLHYTDVRCFSDIPGAHIATILKVEI